MFNIKLTSLYSYVCGCTSLQRSYRMCDGTPLQPTNNFSGNVAETLAQNDGKLLTEIHIRSQQIPYFIENLQYEKQYCT